MAIFWIIFEVIAVSIFWLVFGVIAVAIFWLVSEVISIAILQAFQSPVYQSGQWRVGPNNQPVFYFMSVHGKVIKKKPRKNYKIYKLNSH